MTDDEFQSHVTREAALAAGQWLIDSNALNKPVHTLKLPELEAMTLAAISRFIVLMAERHKESPTAETLQLLMGG